jgi:hypothetical protein
MTKIFVKETGLVNKKEVSSDLNRVEKETIILPMLTDIKNIKRISIMNRCNRKEPTITTFIRYETVALVNKKKP